MGSLPQVYCELMFSMLTPLRQQLPSSTATGAGMDFASKAR